jgi:hypothetical protein
LAVPSDDFFIRNCPAIMAGSFDFGGMKKSTISRLRMVSGAGAAALVTMAIAACHTPAISGEAVGACSESQTFIHYAYLEGLTGKSLSLFIDQDGDAEFNGDTARPGKHHVKLSRATMNGLINEIQASGLFDMKSWYGAPPNDGGSVDLVVCLRGRSKEITYQPGAGEFGQEPTPHRLLELDQAIIESIGASR